MEWQFQLNWPILIEEAKQRRKSLKITQKRLALMANISTPTVSRFENGEKDIQLSTILNLFGLLGMIDKRNLVFTQSKPYYDPNRELVLFQGQDGTKKIPCKMSLEALTDHFDNHTKNPLKTFLANRTAIEHEVKRKYITNRFEKDDSILIGTKDFL